MTADPEPQTSPEAMSLSRADIITEWARGIATDATEMATDVAVMGPDSPQAARLISGEIESLQWRLSYLWNLINPEAAQ